MLAFAVNQGARCEHSTPLGKGKTETMANTIGVGVIGAGNIAEMNHLPGYQVLGITLQILDAIYESSKTGQMVDIT